MAEEQRLLKYGGRAKAAATCKDRYKDGWMDRYKDGGWIGIRIGIRMRQTEHGGSKYAGEHRNDSRRSCLEWALTQPLPPMISIDSPGATVRVRSLINTSASSCKVNHSQHHSASELAVQPSQPAPHAVAIYNQ